MKKIIMGLLVASLMGGAAYAAPDDQNVELYEGQKVVKGEIIVKSEADSLDTPDESENIGGGWHHVKSGNLTTEELMSIYESEGMECEPNAVIELEPEDDELVDLIPNDPMFNQLWGLHNTGQNGGKVDADIDAPEAWDITTGSTSIVVGVVDTGISYNHPDLKDNVWSAPSAYTITFGSTVYSCPAGSHGFNAITNTCDPLDDNSHGTHCSGTIGGTGNNGVGVAGVNLKTKIVGFKFLDAGGGGSNANAIKAINFAVALKAKFPTEANIRVLSNSWGGGGFSPGLFDAIKAADQAGILFTAAAGNGGRSIEPPNTPFYPADYDSPNVMSIAATDSSDLKASFSNWGLTTVDLGAPGVGTVSTILNNGYGSKSGTSMATPHVSGAAALVLAKCPNLTPAQLRLVLIASVDKTTAMNGITVSGGRLNVKKALDQCGGVITPPPTPNAPTVTLVANPLNVAPGGSTFLTWSSTNATSCIASGSWSGSKNLEGNATITNLQSTQTYTLTCSNSGGSTAKSVTVTVGTTTPPPTADPVVVLTATPNKVGVGGSTTIAWTASNATSCVASGDWSGTKTTSGSQTISNLQSSSVFVLLCEGAGGVGVNVEFVDVGDSCTPPANDAPLPTPEPGTPLPGKPGLEPSPIFGAGGGCSLVR